MFSCHIKLALFSCTILTTFGCVSAQTSVTISQASPEQATQSFMDAVKEANYEEMAEVMDPNQLDNFRNKTIQAAKLVSKRTNREPTEILNLFHDVDNVSELEKLNSRELIVSAITMASKNDSRMRKKIDKMNFSIIGSVKEGDDLAHVIVKSEKSSDNEAFLVTSTYVNGKWYIPFGDESSDVFKKLDIFLCGGK